MTDLNDLLYSEAPNYQLDIPWHVFNEEELQGLNGKTLVGGNFTGVCLVFNPLCIQDTGGKIITKTIWGVTFCDVEFESTIIQNIVFQRCAFLNMELDMNQWQNVSFRNCIFRGVEFKSTTTNKLAERLQFTECSFQDCIINFPMSTAFLQCLGITIF